MLNQSLQRVNRTKLKDSGSAVVSGVTVQMSSPEVIEMCGSSGLDFVWIDAEHGSFGLETAVQMFRAADAQGITPLLRVPSLDAVSIMQALDGGRNGDHRSECFDCSARAGRRGLYPIQGRRQWRHPRRVPQHACGPLLDR